MWGLTFFISICTFQGTPLSIHPSWCGTANAPRKGTLPEPLWLHSYLTRILIGTDFEFTVPLCRLRRIQPSITRWTLGVALYMASYLCRGIRCGAARPRCAYVAGSMAFGRHRFGHGGFCRCPSHLVWIWKYYLLSGKPMSALGRRVLSTYCANRLTIT